MDTFPPEILHQVFGQVDNALAYRFLAACEGIQAFQSVRDYLEPVLCAKKSPVTVTAVPAASFEKETIDLGVVRQIRGGVPLTFNVDDFDLNQIKRALGLRSWPQIALNYVTTYHSMPAEGIDVNSLTLLGVDVKASDLPSSLCLLTLSKCQIEGPLDLAKFPNLTSFELLGVKRVMDEQEEAESNEENDFPYVLEALEEELAGELADVDEDGDPGNDGDDGDEDGNEDGDDDDDEDSSESVVSESSYIKRARKTAIANAIELTLPPQVTTLVLDSTDVKIAGSSYPGNQAQAETNLPSLEKFVSKGSRVYGIETLVGNSAETLTELTIQGFEDSYTHHEKINYEVVFKSPMPRLRRLAIRSESYKFKPMEFPQLRFLQVWIQNKNERGPLALFSDAALAQLEEFSIHFCYYAWSREELGFDGSLLDKMTSLTLLHMCVRFGLDVGSLRFPALLRKLALERVYLDSLGFLPPQLEELRYLLKDNVLDLTHGTLRTLDLTHERYNAEACLNLDCPELTELHLLGVGTPTLTLNCPKLTTVTAVKGRNLAISSLPDSVVDITTSDHLYDSLDLNYNSVFVGDRFHMSARIVDAPYGPKAGDCIISDWGCDVRDLHLACGNILNLEHVVLGSRLQRLVLRNNYELDLSTLQLPASVEVVKMEYDGPILSRYDTTRFVLPPKLFLDCPRLRMLLLKRINVKFETPLALPASLERLELLDNVSDQIALSFVGGDPALEAVVLNRCYAEREGRNVGPFKIKRNFARWSYALLGGSRRLRHMNVDYPPGASDRQRRDFLYRFIQKKPIEDLGPYVDGALVDKPESLDDIWVNGFSIPFA